MTMHENEQTAEIARLRAALTERTEDLAATTAALTVMHVRYEYRSAEADVLAAIARAAIPVVTQPIDDAAIMALFMTLKAYESWDQSHPAPSTDIVVVEVPAMPARRCSAAARKKTTVPKPVAA